jgi:thiol-disulfide isomerase/thioredoxin
MKQLFRFAVLGWALWASPTSTAAEFRPLFAQAKAPSARFITPAQLKSTLAGHKGRVLVLHFWATWCWPCMQELPLLAKLAREAGPRGIDFVPVSLDDATERNAAWVGRVLHAKTGDASWSPILKWDPADANIDDVVDPAWGGEIPVFFSFDREGRLRHAMVGTLGRGDFERLVGDLVVPAAK